MRSACSRCWHVFINGRDLSGWSNAQSFDVGCFATRREARSWVTEAIAKAVTKSIVIVSHLSETTCVETHLGRLGDAENSLGDWTDMRGQAARRQFV